jgi:hypothetical protein
MKQLKAIHDLFLFEDDLFRNEAEIFRNKLCTGIGQNNFSKLNYNTTNMSNIEAALADLRLQDKLNI